MDYQVTLRALSLLERNNIFLKDQETGSSQSTTQPHRNGKVQFHLAHQELKKFGVSHHFQTSFCLGRIIEWKFGWNRFRLTVCDLSAPILTICSLLMYVDNDLVPSSISSLHSTGSVVGCKSIEVGTTGKILLVGQFTKTLQYQEGDISVQGMSHTDIFIARFSQQGTNDLMSAFGGEGVDEAKHLLSILQQDLLLLAQLNQARLTISSVRTDTRLASTLGNGGKDILMLQITPNGLITDGFTFGTNQSDSVGEHSIDETGLVYMSGYIGGTMQHPISNTTLGLEKMNAHYFAIVNMSGGSGITSRGFVCVIWFCE